jgi:hypothetical protein
MRPALYSHVAIAGFAVAFSSVPAAHAAVAISSAATTNITCVSGVCTPTAPNAVLNVSDLQSMLASGNVSIEAAGEPVDIDIQAAFSWSSTNSLTLDSYHSVNVGDPVAVSGGGGLTVVTNDGGSGGWLTFAPNANVEFSNLSSSLAINGAGYTLVGDIRTLASDVAANPSGNFALANDYNAQPDGTYSAAPVNVQFSGNFQGLGNAISNLTISSKAIVLELGLFSAANAGSTISNLVIQNAQVSANKRGADAGILVGHSQGVLFGDHTSGTVFVGASDFGGGLAAYGATVIGSSSSAMVSGKVGAGIGGLLAGGGTIDSCFATGKGGGFVEAANAVTNSYSTGTVEGTGTQSTMGGFVGVAGIDGESQSVSTSYSTGALTGTGEKGGFAGVFGLTAVASNDYWDTETSGTSNASGNEHAVSGVTGLTTHQLKSRLPTGFDPTIWAQSPSINNGFPYLIANPPQ